MQARFDALVKPAPSQKRKGRRGSVGEDEDGNGEEADSDGDYEDEESQIDDDDDDDALIYKSTSYVIKDERMTYI